MADEYIGYLNVEAGEAVVHVVNPIDEFTGLSVVGGEVYISLDGSVNPPFSYIGAVPQDIWFGNEHPYELNKSYGIIVKVDGYIFTYEQLALSPGDDITSTGILLNCAGPTPNFNTGCELLKHYDSNSDGYHSMDDTLDAIRDWHDGLITLTGVNAIIKSWAGDGINYLCSDCHIPAEAIGDLIAMKVDSKTIPENGTVDWAISEPCDITLTISNVGMASGAFYIEITDEDNVTLCAGNTPEIVAGDTTDVLCGTFTPDIVELKTLTATITP